MRIFARIWLLALLAAALFFAGCAGGSQPQPGAGGAGQPKEITKIVYICPDGSEASSKSLCALPTCPKCEEAEKQAGTTGGAGGAADGAKPAANLCGGAKNVSCSKGYYCELEEGANEGSCTKMVPVGITLTPPSTEYPYYLDGAWTGDFNVSNSGSTPIELYATSDSKYVEILTNDSIYLKPGERATIKYRLWFSDSNLPVGTNTLSISVNAPVDGFRIRYFKMTVLRRY